MCAVEYMLSHEDAALIHSSPGYIRSALDDVENVICNLVEDLGSQVNSSPLHVVEFFASAWSTRHITGHLEGRYPAHPSAATRVRRHAWRTHKGNFCSSLKRTKTFYFFCDFPTKTEK